MLVLRRDANDPVGDIRRETGAQLVQGILLPPCAADNHIDIGCRAQNLLKEWQATEEPGFMAELRMKHAVEVQKECAHRKSIGCLWLRQAFKGYCYARLKWVRFELRQLWAELSNP